MNLFLDTSALFSTPFWNSTHSKLILKAAENGLVKIHMSRVVLEELKHNYLKNFRSHSDKLKTALQKINLLTDNKFSIDIKTEDELSTSFDEFYRIMSEYDYFTLVEVPESVLRESLHRAINKIKPFTEKKQEFKDSVIWLSYVEFAKKHNLDKCYLLTKNIHDFASSDDSEILHEVLNDDYSKFLLCKSFREFFEIHKDKLTKPVNKFENWLKVENVNNSYVFDLLYDCSDSLIDSDLDAHFDKYDPTSWASSDWMPLLGGYTEVTEIEWFGVSDIQIDIVTDYAIISGVLEVGVHLDIYGYNSVRDPGDEKHPYFGNQYFETDLVFSFKLDDSKSVDDFEIHEISIKVDH